MSGVNNNWIREIDPAEAQGEDITEAAIIAALGYTPLESIIGEHEAPDAAPGAYTLANSGIVVKNANGDEIFRIWGTDPNEDNYNCLDLYVGLEAGYSKPTDNVSAGYFNVGVGAHALYSATTGFNNTAVGHDSLKALVGGSHNTAAGERALFQNVSGSNNVGVGQNVLYFSTGNNNTAIGKAALITLTTGDGNTAFGANADVAGALSNAMALGYAAQVIASNTAVIGNASVTDAYFGSVAAAANAHAKRFFIVGNTAPADGDLAANQAALWFDPANGAAKLMVKAKQADGTVKVGSFNVQT